MMNRKSMRFDSVVAWIGAAMLLGLVMISIRSAGRPERSRGAGPGQTDSENFAAPFRGGDAPGSGRKFLARARRATGGVRDAQFARFLGRPEARPGLRAGSHRGAPARNRRRLRRETSKSSSINSKPRAAARTTNPFTWKMFTPSCPAPILRFRKQCSSSPGISTAALPMLWIRLSMRRARMTTHPEWPSAWNARGC